MTSIVDDQAGYSWEYTNTNPGTWENTETGEAGETGGWGRGRLWPMCLADPAG